MQADTGQHDRRIEELAQETMPTCGGPQELWASLDQFEIEASGFEAASAQWLR